MFEQLFKRRKGQNPPNKGKDDDDSENLEAPDLSGVDAKNALDDIDAALAAAEGEAVMAQEQKRFDEERQIMKQIMSVFGGSCGCGGPPPKNSKDNY
jgi:hypothetical protein